MSLGKAEGSIPCPTYVRITALQRCTKCAAERDKMSAIAMPAPMSAELAAFVDSVLAGNIPAAPTPAPVAPTHERRADRDEFMATVPPSKGQMKRISAKYESLGGKGFSSLAKFRAMFPTMLDASREWEQIRNAQ